MRDVFSLYILANVHNYVLVGVTVRNVDHTLWAAAHV